MRRKRDNGSYGSYVQPVTLTSLVLKLGGNCILLSWGVIFQPTSRRSYWDLGGGAYWRVYDMYLAQTEKESSSEGRCIIWEY